MLRPLVLRPEFYVRYTSEAREPDACASDESVFFFLLCSAETSHDRKKGAPFNITRRIIDQRREQVKPQLSPVVVVSVVRHASK